MTCEQAVKTALETIAPLRAQVYPAQAIKNAAAPFVFYEITSEDEEQTLSGDPNLRRAAFHVHCVAKNYAQLILISGLVRSALKHLQGARRDDLLIEQTDVRLATPDIDEKEVHLLRRAYSVEIYYQIEEVAS